MKASLPIYEIACLLIFTWRIKSLLSEHFALLDVDHLQGFFLVLIDILVFIIINTEVTVSHKYKVQNGRSLSGTSFKKLELVFCWLLRNCCQQLTQQF